MVAMKQYDNRISLRTAAVMMAGVIGAFFTGSYVKAMPGGATRSTLGFAGTIRKDGRPVTTTQELTFKFKKAGIVQCSSPPLNATPDASGNFQVQIPIDTCPNLFDGSDIALDVLVGSTVVAPDQPVGPVPYAKYADRVGLADCPIGYGRDTGETTFVVCKKGSDEIVLVGKGPSSFWIDRYEASVWSKPDGTGTPYDGSAGYPIPANGQVAAEVAAYAASVPNHMPSGTLNWFQASVACRQSGKRLPTGEEWLQAARGTPDAIDAQPSPSTCVLDPSKFRYTGLGTGCTSVWGAQDMVGNLGEWTLEWQASPPASDVDPANAYFTSDWPKEYNGDIMVSVASAAAPAPYDFSSHLPAAVWRGGSARSPKKTAGVFYYDLTVGPTFQHETLGFRCLVPR
jgi:formylglycine-generating enzyme required for sulfatase activity